MAIFPMHLNIVDVEDNKGKSVNILRDSLMRFGGLEKFLPVYI